MEDKAKHTATQTVTINLQNINDNLPVFIHPRPDGSDLEVVQESTAKGTSIYSIEAADSDGDDIEYVFEGQEPSTPVLFTMTDTTVYTSEELDFESGNTNFKLTFR